MARNYERTEGNDPTDRIEVDEIKRKADYVRKKILDDAEIETSEISPNVYNYKMDTDSAGLNEISNLFVIGKQFPIFCFWNITEQISVNKKNSVFTLFHQFNMVF